MEQAPQKKTEILYNLERHITFLRSELRYAYEDNGQYLNQTAESLASQIRELHTQLEAAVYEQANILSGYIGTEVVVNGKVTDAADHSDERLDARRLRLCEVRLGYSDIYGQADVMIGLADGQNDYLANLSEVKYRLDFSDTADKPTA